MGPAGLLVLLALQGGAMDSTTAAAAARESAHDPVPDLARLRSLYLAAVADEAAIDRGLREIERLAAAPDGPSAETLAAYRGALTTLRAKHSLWPPARLRHLREGLEILDAVVDASPELAEARYLRLMSCFYLPGILGRKWSVREDFEALARLLPGARDEYPREVYRAIAAFVLEEGEPGPERRAALERALGGTDG